MRRAAIVLAVVAWSAPASADPETDSLFTAGAKAIAEGRPAQAIDAFEALADRGVVDASASYDRGLAYALRVRIGGEQPGDLGRAAHGFEEARALSEDPTLAGDAAKALAVVRTEVARRRGRSGESVEIDPGVPLLRATAALLPEDAWLVLALVGSCALAAGLGSRARGGGSARRGVAAVVDFIGENRGNIRLPGVMMLGYVGAHTENLAMAVIVSKVSVL
jgi:hypothetical protein